MKKKETVKFLLIPAIAALIISYLGYFIIYLLAKSRVVKRGALPEEITLLGSIPSSSWFVIFSLIALVIGLLTGFIIYKIKTRNKK